MHNQRKWLLSTPLPDGGQRQFFCDARLSALVPRKDSESSVDLVFPVFLFPVTIRAGTCLNFSKMVL